MRYAKRGIRRAAADRDTARARVRRATGGVIGVAAVVTGTLAGYVSNAGSAGTKTTQTTTATPQPTRARSAAPKQVPVPDTPPAPTLIPSQSAPSAPQSPVQSPAPVQAPVQTQQPPVVVSGGS